jgi:hypothetical protein
MHHWQYPLDRPPSHLGLGRVDPVMCRIPDPHFRIPSPDLDKQAPYRVVHEILMPLDVNWVPHCRQGRDASCMMTQTDSYYHIYQYQYPRILWKAQGQTSSGIRDK